MVVQGMGGLMSVTGQPNSEPTRVGTSIGDITAGLFTAIGVNAALFDRDKNWERKSHRCLYVRLSNCYIGKCNRKISYQKEKFHSQWDHVILPLLLLKLSKQKIATSLLQQEMKSYLKECVERLDCDCHKQEKFKDNQSRNKNIDELKLIIESKLKDKTTEEWVVLIYGKEDSMWTY